MECTMAAQAGASLVATSRNRQSVNFPEEGPFRATSKKMTCAP